MLGLPGCTGFSLVAVHRLLTAAASLDVEQVGFSSFCSRAPTAWLNSCGHWLIVALRYVGSSWTRDRTHVSCIGRWILYHCNTWEAPYLNSSIVTRIPYNASYQ